VQDLRRDAPIVTGTQHRSRRHTSRGSRTRADRAPIDPRVWVSGAFLAVAIIVGGGGSPSPAPELVVELAAVAALVAWAWLVRGDRRYPGPPIDRWLFAMAALVAAIPLLQLVPLPPALWHRLPGRAVEIEALALIGRADVWMPLSESPPRTLASALSLIPPLAMLFMVSRLREQDRLRLIAWLAVLGLLAAVVGAIQLTSGDAHWLRFYSFTHYGFATGFQANRNADADVLLIAAMALISWTVLDRRFTQSRQMQLVVGALYLLLALSLLLTGSRTGIALFSVAILATAALLLRTIAIKNWRLVAAAMVGIATLAGSSYFLVDNARVQRTLDRFDYGDAVRPEIWQDTLYAIHQHWPLGSGIGTFEPVFTAAERLEFVRPDFSNRAHNDYLEFALETGIVAPVLLIVILAFAAVRLWSKIRMKDDQRPSVIGIFVLGSLLVLLFHSLVDYPERSMSLAVVTGMLAGLLGVPGRRAVDGRAGSEGVSE
jgi:O-antigen ligase